MVGAQTSRHPGANYSELGLAPNWGVGGRAVAGCNTGRRACNRLGRIEEEVGALLQRRGGTRLRLATSTDRNVALDSRNYLKLYYF